MLEIRRFSLLAGLIVLYSCSSLNVSVDYDPAVSFANLKTFNWAPGTPIKSGDFKSDSNSFLHRRIKTGIGGWFNSHGYEKINKAFPDFLVTYSALVEKKIQIMSIEDYDDGYGYCDDYGCYQSGFSGYEREYEYEYDYLTITIDIVNSKTKKLMWRGKVGYEVSGSERPDTKTARIAKAIDRVLRKFPPS